jgi:hypothetical protein
VRCVTYESCQFGGSFSFVAFPLGFSYSKIIWPQMPFFCFYLAKEIRMSVFFSCICS